MSTSNGGGIGVNRVMAGDAVDGDRCNTTNE